MSDDRSERLRERRRKTSEKAEPAKRDGSDNPEQPVKPDKQDEDEVVESGKPDKVDKPVKPDYSDNLDKQVIPVKQRENWGPKQIHLPKNLEEEMEIILDETNVRMRRAGEDPLEKLMHWYPLVVQQGIDAIEEMDVTEVQKKVKEFESQ